MFFKKKYNLLRWIRLFKHYFNVFIYTGSTLILWSREKQPSLSFASKYKNLIFTYSFIYEKNVLGEISKAHNNSIAFFLPIINIIHVIVIVVLFTIIKRQWWICAKALAWYIFLLAKNWSLIFDKSFFFVYVKN